MKVVILAGGLGTRLSEETDLRPKPMVTIGNYPVLWHIMKIYSHYGFNEFVICLGYKGYVIKEYFHHYHLHQSDVTIDLKDNSVAYHSTKTEPWKITLVETGINTFTGGRIKKIRKYIGNETFMLTYGDGLANIDIRELIAFHRKKGKLATLTSSLPTGKFGALLLNDSDDVLDFHEKPSSHGAWVNAGFFVLEPKVFDYIPDGDQAVWEREPLEKLAHDGELVTYKNLGFWKPMDTLKDKMDLEMLWNSGKAEWKVWND